MPSATSIRRLSWLGHEVTACDPLADSTDMRDANGLTFAREPEGSFDCIIGAVRHREYIDMTAEEICGLLSPGGMVADLKGIWRALEFPAHVQRWSL